jgi:hypothetical protein
LPRQWKSVLGREPPFPQHQTATSRVGAAAKRRKSNADSVCAGRGTILLDVVFIHKAIFSPCAATFSREYSNLRFRNADSPVVNDYSPILSECLDGRAAFDG